MTDTTSHAAAHAAAQAAAFTHPTGTPVLAWPGARDADLETFIRTRTRSAAWVLVGDHTAVVMVDGIAGAIALSHIEVDHTRRPAVPEVEFTAPPCPMCGEDLETDGDVFDCERCEASWGRDGHRGTWHDPDAPRCQATRHGFASQPPAQCVRPASHAPDGRHHPLDAQEWWRDIDLQAITDAAGQPLGHPPACSECREYTAVDHGMCPSCEHNARRSGWAPGAEQ